MKSYRDLEIFAESKRLAIRIHEMTLSLPKFEIFEEGRIECESQPDCRSAG
jgi:hypothetical protein